MGAMPGARKRPRGSRPGTFLRALGCGARRNFLEAQPCRAGAAAPGPALSAGAPSPSPWSQRTGVLAEAAPEGPPPPPPASQGSEQRE